MNGYISRHDTNAVFRKSDNMIIGPENTVEWADYQAWLAEGNTPEEAGPLPESTEPTIQQKLARAGLTVDELKEALGLI